MPILGIGGGKMGDFKNSTGNYLLQAPLEGQNHHRAGVDETKEFCFLIS